MKIIGIVMLIIPLTGWFIFCGKTEGFRFAAKVFGLAIGGILLLAGWYSLAWYFVGGTP